MDNNINNRLQDDIDRFVNYEMTPEEEVNFINRIKCDEALKRKVFLSQLIVEAERKKAEKEMLFHTNPACDKYSIKVRLKWMAACLCILMVSLLFYGRTYDLSTQEILNTVYTPPVWESLRSEGFPTIEAARINHYIEKLYLAGDCDSLIIYYQKLSVGDKVEYVTAKSKMFLGIACLQRGNVEQAYSFAKELRDNQNQEVGDWLWLGCLLYDGKRKEATEMAVSISRQKHLYSEEARRIYEALNQRKWF